jgi:DNA-binding GntR family transcriptional regulator
MPIKPLQKVSLVDGVVSAIREQIAGGHIKPGETLRIEALAREFGVSRTPIREAFSKLEAEGILVRQTGYAATVFTPTREEVCEYYEMRLVLEPLAGRLAFPNMTRAVERRLDSLVAKMDNLTTNGRYGLHREFHRVLYEPSGRRFLTATIANLIERSDLYIRMYFKSHDLGETQRSHRRILHAVEGRDEEAFVAAIEDHVAGAMSHIVAEIPQEVGT